MKKSRLASLNLRISEEMEEKLKSAVEKLNKKALPGTEANISTVVRGAIKDFIEKIESL